MTSAERSRGQGGILRPQSTLPRRPRRGPRRLVAVAALVMILSALGACSDGDSVSPSGTGSGGERLATSFTALIDQALAKDDLTPEVRDILERSRQDGAIAQADYEAAFGRYAKCVRDAGVREEYTKLPSGVYRVTPNYSTQSEEAERADFEKSNECGYQHLAAVESLFTLQAGNPDLLSDSNEVAVRCLIKAGLVESHFTAADFKTLVEKNFEGAPFDLTDQGTIACLASAGMAVAGRPGS